MEWILQGIGLLFWLILVPLGMGLWFIRLVRPEKRKYGMVLVLGYIFMLASFELVSLVILLQRHSRGFRYVRTIYGVLAVVIALSGYILTYYLKQKKGQSVYVKPFQLYGSRWMWLIAVMLLGFNLWMAMTHANFDGDDAYYVVQSQLTEETDTMYTLQPYTGGSTGLDIRHAMALFTMWIAFIGRMCGIHSTILCHLVLPVFLIPLAYLIQSMIGRELLQEKKEMLPYFVVMLELLYLFGNVSIYTSETFLLTRTWQGKSVACNVLLPATILWLLVMFIDYDKKKDRSLWWIVSTLTIVAGALSSLAVILCAMVICISGFFMSIKEKHFMTLVYTGLSCIPAALYILLYQFVWYIIK